MRTALIKTTPFHLPRPLAFAIIAGCLGLIAWQLWPIYRVVLQAYALIALVLAFRYWPPLIRLVAGMPVMHRIVFGVMLGGIIAGHFTFQSRRFFPYVAWEIFPAAHESDPVLGREFVGTTAEGRTVRLIPEQLFPSVTQFYTKFPGDPHAPEKDELLSRALGRMYNQLHPADPVRQVDLILMAVPLHPPASESRAEPSCEFLQRYDLSSAP